MSQAGGNRKEHCQQHSQDHDAEKCRDCERELRPTDAVKGSQFRQIDQVNRGRHENSTKNSDRQIGKHIANVDYGSS